MKRVITGPSILVTATLVLGPAFLAGCEGSDTTDVSGHVRQHDSDTPKVDPNAMPGEGSGIQDKTGG